MGKIESGAGDNAGYFPDAKSAAAYLAGASGSNTSARYHADRMRALRLLIDGAGLSRASRVIDFGCGDGLYFREAFPASSAFERIVGVDISAPMIELAAQSMRGLAFEGRCGGLDQLKTLYSGSFDLGLAIDVLGYLGPEDLMMYYREMSRLIRPGGHLLVMWGNELFDMFALNGGTAEFYVKHFGIDVADVLVESRSPQYKPVERANPLSYAAELAPYGFEEVKQAFSQWHRLPPAIGNRGADVAAARLAMRDHDFDPNALPPAERWKAAFRCSIFASLSRRAA